MVLTLHMLPELVHRWLAANLCTSLSYYQGIDGLNFIGADVVEVAPAYDHAEITAIAAATIAHDYLVIRAKQKMKAK